MSMAETKLSMLLLLAVTMAAAGLLAGSPSAEALDVCGQDATNLVLQCQNYVRKDGPKVQPSKPCCGEVQKFDVTCVCKSLPPGVDKYVSLEKLVFVARCCGKKLPAGTKCGNYVVPPESEWLG